MKRFIYADNAATTPLDPSAFEAMKPYLLQEYGNASQPYSLARQPKKALREARESIARCIGAAPEEIFFTSGGTESDNWAIKGSAFSNANGSSILTSAFEHHAVLHACRAMERMGASVRYLSPSADGQISPDALRAQLSAPIHLASIMFANNEIGSIQPIQELCEIVHEHGAVFHTDAVQAVGHIPIDVERLGVDLLSASAHKFNGPKGVGFLFVRRGTPLSPYLDGGAQERGMRAGTENVAGIVGMARALSANVSEMADHRRHLRNLERQLLEGLRAGGIAFSRNGGTCTLPGLLSLSFPNADGEALLHRLDLMGIAVSTGSACNSQRTEISHVLKAIKLEESLARGTIRISLGRENTEADVTAIVQGLSKILTSP